MRPLRIFLNILDHVDVLGCAHGITIIVDHFGGEINNFECMEASTTHLEEVHEYLGRDVVVDSLCVE